jgi:hypothetical protein
MPYWAMREDVVYKYIGKCQDGFDSFLKDAKIFLTILEVL